MINAKGETIYTSAEIAYELGLSPATINAVGRRLFGNRIAHWTLTDVKLIVQYVKSIQVEEQSKRLEALHQVVESIMGDQKLDDAETKKRVTTDIHLKRD